MAVISEFTRRTIELWMRAAMARILRFGGEIHTIVGRFLGDCDVVRMALGHARSRYAAKAGVFPQFLDVFRAAISHACSRNPPTI